jgi:hypothetical protein
MMQKIYNHLLVLLILAFLPLATNAQYFGGISNGFGSVSTLNLNLNLTDSLYNGGLGNGFYILISPSTNLSLVDSLYNGGVGNGYFTNNINTDLSIQDSLYNGGIGKGDNQLISVLIRLSPCNDNLLVWNGNANAFWNNPTNWDCGNIPINTSRVTIPSNATRMPIIAASAIASRVTVLSNANINLIGGASLLSLTGQ